MAVFRRLVCIALCAGLIAGVVSAVAHQFATVPLILEAETLEQPAGHDRAAAWEPENGIERTFFTLAADLLAAIGFALLLAAGMTLQGSAVNWRDGLLWGLAGFAVFTLAPGLGLPPEIPGAAAAPLAARQLWWLSTAIATGAGFALLVFTRRAPWAALAVLLIALPHLYGAPQPAGSVVDAAPAALVHRFITAVTLTSLLFWVSLGTATGYFYRRFAPQPEAQ